MSSLINSMPQSFISMSQVSPHIYSPKAQAMPSPLDSFMLSNSNHNIYSNELAKMNALRNSAFSCNLSVSLQLPDMPPLFPCGSGGIMGNMQSLLQSQMQMLLEQAMQILQTMQAQTKRNQMLQMQMLQTQMMQQPQIQFPQQSVQNGTGNIAFNQFYNQDIQTRQLYNYIENPDNFPAGITVVGSEEYKAQVNEKIAQLKKTPEGQKLFAELAKTGKPIRIAAPPPYRNQDSAKPDNGNDIFPFADGTPGRGCGSTVYFNPSDKTDVFGDKGDNRTTLFHELVHSYNYATGTMQEGTSRLKDPYGAYFLEHAEYQAVGLDNPNAIEVTYPDGIRRKGNPPEFTENAIRKRFNLPMRDRYFLDELKSHKIQSDVINK